ncbi:MAG: Deoxyuridine 5'-triphosphate nucleotidohydrolase Dut [Candidatus Magasanikbacteria bacterium GW2011_GWA2_56_11]|uniref:dUTP diphosphatase n=1 Tax=Candidatus Magasanikbacteria bacterium GW2011_GWA2_56_11 TaxID=1619044 RepID=A0A0G2BBH9_9BACT|nr:MAG: Deoxyuridine 5'-triphosphate nucleotidohydrolase Dut [Candidatus Magasanikbacteria bacterium GW2011_GWA2_56_11]
MQVKIKRFDPSLPLPDYQTPGAAAFDIYSRIPATIKAGETAFLPTNLIIATPPGYMLMISARSSSAKKKGLTMRNGIGIIDQDYCGNADEIHLLAYNFTDHEVTIERGERLAQGIFVKIDRADWLETETMSAESRGGFGSTGG